MIHRMKIGAIFVAAVEMTEEEWSAIDPGNLAVEARIRQGNDLFPVAHMFNAETRAIELRFDTTVMAVGRAEFDVWISGGPIPWASNVTLELMQGVGR